MTAVIQLLTVEMGGQWQEITDSEKAESSWFKTKNALKHLPNHLDYEC
jgi:hypothetical protein